jgi:catechol 2,3-dioxygenase-like lactoylglutathione lyase family enzyme
MRNTKLYETHVDTVNLEKAIEFYQSLDLELAYKLEERRVAFFWLGDPEKKEQMLGVWEVRPEKFTRKHFAFQVDLEVLLTVPAYLQARGIELRESFGLEPLEPVVHAWMPAAAYYFLDPDGNSLEYISILNDEPKPELGVLYLSEWKQHV